MTGGITSSNGGTGLIAVEAGLLPKMPMSRNRMQIEFTQASFRFGIPVRRRQAEPGEFIPQLVARQSSIRIHEVYRVTFGSKHITDRAEETEAHAVLGGVDADAAAVAQFVDVIGHVDDVEPRFQELLLADIEGLFRAEVHE